MRAAWRSLRLRFVASYLALALLLLAITGLVFSALINLYADLIEREQMAAHVARVREILTDATAAQLPPDTVERRLQQELPGVKIERIPFTLEEEGRFRPRLPDPPPGAAFFLTLRNPATSSWALSYVPARSAPILFRFTLPARSSAVLKTLTAQVLVILGLAFALAALVGWWLSRWLSRPLAQLTAATAAVARGDFLQTHELQTPTAALRAYHDVVADRPDRFQQVLPALRRQVERMERIIAGLLEMAALGEDTGSSLVPADAGEVVRRFEPVLSDLSDEYGHTLVVQVEGGALPVRLDPRLLELALTNLVDNACKYTPGAAQIELRVRQESDQAVIAVTDPGPGIPTDELPYIFERFRRGIATQGTPDTGLGLAIVNEAVQRLGGTVTAARRAGQPLHHPATSGCDLTGGVQRHTLPLCHIRSRGLYLATGKGVP